MCENKKIQDMTFSEIGAEMMSLRIQVNTYRSEATKCAISNKGKTKAILFLILLNAIILIGFLYNV